MREAPRFYHDECEIDAGDVQTEGGDVSVDFADEIGSEGLVVWVWTGDLGDEADEDDTLEIRFDSDSLPPPEPSQLTIIYRGLRTNPADDSPVRSARAGTEVTVTLQLQGSYPGEAELINTPSPDGGAEYSVRITVTMPDDDNDPANDVVRAIDTESIVLGADGSASFDLPTYNFLEEYDVNFNLTEVRGAVAPPAEHVGDSAAGVTVKFRSGDPEPTIILVDPLRDVITADSGSDVRSNVRVSVLDQFGRPLAGVEVFLQSDADSASWSLTQASRTYTTRTSGVVIGYLYSGAAAIETLTAGVDGDDPASDPRLDTGCADDSYSGNDVCGSAMVYWVPEEVGDAQTTALDVLDIDAEADTLMVDTDTGNGKVPAVVSYDAGDYFTLDDDPVRVDAFEEAIAARLKEIEDGDSTSAPMLQWSNYHPDEPADDSITSWTLTIPA